MLLFLTIALLSVSGLANSVEEHYSFSRNVGRGNSGTTFSTEGEGRITAVRIWEHNNAYIAGIQLRYGYIWSTRVGRTVGSPIEMDLLDDERIIQVSGKYHTTNYIYQLYFVTSRGRFLVAGQPIQISFNMYPTHRDAELIILSGRADGNGITSLGAHWGVVYMGQDHGTSSNSTALA
ncbi:zymogen granule membrane protein 16-like [Nelusetta ayraudi]|uniref:zymogen granule membrane protein 16-like n=1 Tax=Nelusetta ayraudi TaxID=303726 RepID=UPI003F701AA1